MNTWQDIAKTVAASVIGAAAIGVWRWLTRRRREQLKAEAAERKKRADAEAERWKRLEEQFAAQAKLNEDNKSVQRGILHGMIFGPCNEYLLRGSITLAEMDNMRHLMDAYELVDGNGTAHIIWGKVQKLPVTVADEPAPLRDSFPDEIRVQYGLDPLEGVTA